MVKKMVPDYIRAHNFCRFNKSQTLQGETCGCFYCLAIFNSREIEDWIPEVPYDSVTDKSAADLVTALCPYCGIDSVIGARSGFPITKDFLQKMHDYWF